jgi:hypothetical protein
VIQDFVVRKEIFSATEHLAAEIAETKTFFAIFVIMPDEKYGVGGWLHSVPKRMVKRYVHPSRQHKIDVCISLRIIFA